MEPPVSVVRNMLPMKRSRSMDRLPDQSVEEEEDEVSDGSSTENEIDLLGDVTDEIHSGAGSVAAASAQGQFCDTKSTDMPKRQKQCKPTPSPPISSDIETYGVEFKDDTQRQRFKALLPRRVVPSRAICSETMHALSIYDNVRILTSRIHLWDFLNRETATYRLLVLEFLSSLEIDATNLSMSFRIFGKDLEMTASHVNKLFGFPDAGMQELAKPDLEFWRRVTGEWVAVHGTKMTEILHPAVRYIHQALALSLFSRGLSASTVTRVEYFFLWCMLHHPDPIHPDPIKHLHHVMRNSKRGGCISIGGIITAIAEHFGMECSGLSEKMGSNKPIDLQSLANSAAISISCEQGCSVYYHYFRNGRSVRFPCAPRIDLADPYTCCVNPDAPPPQSILSQSSFSRQRSAFAIAATC